jgi:hypothetical protein
MGFKVVKFWPLDNDRNAPRTHDGQGQDTIRVVLEFDVGESQS